MNSTIFVQSPVNEDLLLDGNRRSPLANSTWVDVTGVIRPAADGDVGTTTVCVSPQLSTITGEMKLRIDPAEEEIPAPPHIRISQFEDYTNWLSQRSAQRLLGSPRPQAESAMPIASKSVATSSFTKATEPRSAQKAQAGDPWLSAPDRTERESRSPAPGVDSRPLRKPHFSSVSKKVQPPRQLEPPIGLSDDDRNQDPIPTALPAESNKVPRSQFEISSPLPMTAAALEVEDFYWPAITSNLILIGAPSINQLGRTVSGLLTPTAQRLAITSNNRRDGGTSLAISLARWAANQRKRVLLVDADISKPDVGNLVGLAPDLSWLDAMKRADDLAEVVVYAKSSGVSIMPLSAPSTRKSLPRLVFDRLGEFLDSIRDHFELVLIDMGPASQLMTHLSNPSTLIDAALLVYDVKHTPTNELARTKAGLISFGIERLAVAENFAPVDVIRE